MKKYIFTGNNFDSFESCHYRETLHGEFTGRRVGYDTGPRIYHEHAQVMLTPKDGITAQECCEIGTDYFRLGLIELSMQQFRRAVALDPHSSLAHSFLIIGNDYAGTAPAERIAELRQWAKRHIDRKKTFPKFRNTRDKKRRIRVGYVSADFCRHSAFHTWFPVIREHDRSKFTVYCYYNGVARDDYTVSCRLAADEWRDVVTLKDIEFFSLIRADEIDILVDLSGHTGGHRLKAFAMHPAPIQLPGFGFVEGNGLASTTYVWGDKLLLTPEERKAVKREVFDLSSAFIFEPPADMPTVSELPSAWDEPFTFGCLNKLDKITDATLALWKRVLDIVPDSRLILKDQWYDDINIRTFLAVRLHRAGFDSKRVILYGPTTHTQHMEIFDEIDLALDPFPHGGGTSTAEALYMGVPVITLYGSAAPGRLTGAILQRCGMSMCVAHTEDEYVEIARTLAAPNARQALQSLRATLRARALGSSVFNVRYATAQIELAYGEMFRRWCSKHY